MSMNAPPRPADPRRPKLDLNLLYALRVLLVEQSVTRAAELMHVSQPAMSGILSRLREHFGDPLIVPVGRRMQLTPLGEGLIEPISDALRRVEAALHTVPDFDPARSTRRFTVVATDYVFSVMLRSLLAALSREAPLVTVDLLPPTRLGGAHLDAGEVDLLILPADFAAPEHPSQPLFDDDHRLVAALDHSGIGETVSLEQYLGLRHVVCKRDIPTHFDVWFARHFDDGRRIDLTVNTFTQMAMCIPETERVGVVLTRYGQQLTQLLPLKLSRLSFGCPRTHFVVQWHRQRETDLGLRWLRDRVVQQSLLVTQSRPS